MWITTANINKASYYVYVSLHSITRQKHDSGSVCGPMHDSMVEINLPLDTI